MSKVLNNGTQQNDQQIAEKFNNSDNLPLQQTEEIYVEAKKNCFCCYLFYA